MMPSGGPSNVPIGLRDSGLQIGTGGPGGSGGPSGSDPSVGLLGTDNENQETRRRNNENQVTSIQNTEIIKPQNI